VWSASQAVVYALEHSPDIQVAGERIREAEARLAASRVPFNPQVSLSGGYTQTNNPMYSFGNILNMGKFTPAIDFNDPGRTDNLNVTAGLEYRFYNGGRDEAGVRAANAGIDASLAGEDAVRLQLGFEVFKSFQRIVDAENIRRARNASLEAIRSSLAVARARHAAGDLLKVDLLNLEVQESSFQENLIGAEHDLKLAKEIFLQLLGLGRREVQVSPEIEKITSPQDVDISGHPRLRALRAQIAAAQAELEAAQGGRRPTVDGFARYQYDKGTVISGDGNSWMAGMKVDFKVFDAHKTDTDIARVQARLGVLRAREHKLELALGLDLTRAKLDLEQAVSRRKVAAKKVEQALESENLSRAQFKAGVLLSSDLIDSENRLTGAKVGDVLAESAVELAKADLRRAAGLGIFSDVQQSTKE